MALMVDQQHSNFKHYCKICKKGFGCGRALGGHMRAHGIGDESGHFDEDDQASDWEDKSNIPAPSNKRMYALRANPNRLKNCRVCEHCGKEFLSWKSFLEHGKCSSEDAESLVSSPGSDGDVDGTPRRGCGGWSKRKRSLRAKVDNFNSICPSSEEEDLANCLMMLSNATVDPLEAEPEESCASASKDEEQRRNTMNFIAPISCRSMSMDKAKGVATKGLFECKACKKVFNSHQALGGHRASHKKVKGCFAARLDHMDDSLADEDHDVITHEEFFPTKSTSNYQFDHGTNTPLPSTSKRKSKVHECSICHRVFSSGQALGGHKRCHWITSNSPDTSSLAKFHKFHHDTIQRPKFIDNSDPLDLKLDLNLPAPDDNQAAAAARREHAKPSSFEVSTEMYLQPWMGKESKEDNHHSHQVNSDHKNINNKYNCNNSSLQIVEDEADSKVKLAKLSELKDMNMNEGSSPWLQVGIGSTTDVEADP
ncbi:zinc finger protein ZAT9-like [Mangifera indica]|uniref:zinc finger protein ZAT9-like n=1 Tax=Mangifera indica TaxID=29780 RepID=UPI001CFBE1A9|nr:zinc finger protein ZAT9-like [Mangifera indica]